MTTDRQGQFPLSAPDYNPADEQFDSQRLNVLAEVLTALVNAPTRDEVTGEPWGYAWPRLCVWRNNDGTYAMELNMPRRMDTHGGTYFSSHPLMDPTWDGIKPRDYAEIGDALRALLDNIVYRVRGPRAVQPASVPLTVSPKLKTTPKPEYPRKIAVNIGGEGQF